jgi:hypothetical protein
VLISLVSRKDGMPKSGIKVIIYYFLAFIFQKKKFIEKPFD